MIRKELLKIIEANNLLALFLQEYPLQVHNAEIITEGHENASYYVTAREGEFVLRIYKPDKSVDQIRAEINFMHYLNSQHIPVPAIFKNKNNELQTVIRIDSYDVPAIMMPKILGMVPETYTEPVVKEIGSWMAKLHLASEQYSDPQIPAWGTTVKEYFTSNNEIDFAKITDKKIKDFLLDAKAFAWNISNLPQGIIHADFHKNNIIIVNEKIVGILDFDDIHQSAFVQDLGVMIWNLLYNYKFKNMPLELVKMLIDSYVNKRPITNDERSSIPNAVHHRNYGLAAFFATLQEDINTLNIDEYYIMRELIENALSAML